MPIFEFDGRRPSIDPSAWIAPTAVIIGDVEVGPGASVWFGAILRGDTSRITVGPSTNIQDNCVIHVSTSLPTVLGQGVTVGHGAMLEGCVVGDGSLVGMGSIMLQRSRLGTLAMLAAGSVLGEGREIASGRLGAGVPAKDRGEVSPETAARWLAAPADNYREKASRFRETLRQIG